MVINNKSNKQAEAYADDLQIDYDIGGEIIY